MKKILLFVIVLLLGFSLSARGTDESQPAKDVTISFYGRFDPQGSDVESKYFIEKVKEFNDAQNGVKVEMVFLPQEQDYLNRLSTDMASGNFPSIFMEYGGSRILDYMDANLLLDLTKYFDKDPDWYNSVGKSYWKTVTIDGYEGTYGIPFGAYLICLVYNEKYLNDYGLAVPTTWKEVMEASAVLKKNGIQPFMVGEKDTYRFGHLFSNLAITKYGEEAIKIGTREIPYNSPQAREIYQLMIDAFKAGYFGDNVLSVNSSEERAYMGAGKSAFMWDLTSRIYWLENTQELNAGNLKITHFPAVNPEFQSWAQGGASQNWYVTNKGSAAEVEASVSFLKYITSKEFISGLAAKTNSTYAINTDSTSDIYIYQEVAEVMANTDMTIQELQNYDTAPGAINIVRDALQEIALGASAEEVGQMITKGYSEF